MTSLEAELGLPETSRRRVFRLLVTAQDMEISVTESRQMVVDICGLSEGQVIKIEREGLSRRWPPL